MLHPKELYIHLIFETDTKTLKYGVNDNKGQLAEFTIKKSIEGNFNLAIAMPSSKKDSVALMNFQAFPQ